MSYKQPKVSPPRTGPSEFELLKASHKFLRDEQQLDSSTQSWNEQLAEKYYANLYKEFAVCDLKHYKSGNFALRWRTEDEVLSGAGETTCANTRCEHHRGGSKVPLTTLELPFAYVEHGEEKSALVKVILCDRCVRKLMWKKNKYSQRALKSEKDLEGSVSAEGSNHDRKRKSLDDGDDAGKGKRKGKSKAELHQPSEDHAHGQRNQRKRHRFEDNRRGSLP